MTGRWKSGQNNFQRYTRDKAKTVDQQYCGSSPHQKGPVERKLDQFGDISCFVIGQFCEASPDLHKYIAKCASEKSKRMANVLGRPPSAFEESQVLQQLRRRLSVCAVRSQASCLLARLGHTGEKAWEAAMRRDMARSREETIRQDMIAHWESSVRSRHITRVGQLHI